MTSSGRLSWLLVSFREHIKYLRYHIPVKKHYPETTLTTYAGTDIYLHTTNS